MAYYSGYYGKPNRVAVHPSHDGCYMHIPSNVGNHPAKTFPNILQLIQVRKASEGSIAIVKTATNQSIC